MTTGSDDLGSHARLISYPLSLGGITTRVLEAGSGDDRILLLHGAGSRSDRWSRTIPGLVAAGYHVTAFDFPGHGLAEKPEEFEYSTPSFARLVEDFLRGSGRSALVGTSLGGHVAAWVAVNHPELVSAVVLVGTTGIVTRVNTTSQVLGDRSETGVRAKLEMLLDDRTRIDDSFVREEWLVNTSPGAEQAIDRVMDYARHGINDHLIGARLAESGIPTRVVWGANDRWIPLEVGRRVAEKLPAAPLYVMRDAGHAPYFERPETFNRLVLDFLRDSARQELGVFEV